MDLKTAEVPLFQKTCVDFKMRQFHYRLKSVCVPRCVTKVSMHLSISHSLCSAVHNYDSLCGRSSRSSIMLSILLVLLLVNAELYGRAGVNPKEYGNDIHCHVCTFAKFHENTTILTCS